MARQRADNDSIGRRAADIEVLERQIQRWEVFVAAKDSPAFVLLTESLRRATEHMKVNLVDLSGELGQEADSKRLQAKGRLEAYDEIFTDLARSAAKIEAARARIAQLNDEIGQARRNGLIETRDPVAP